MARIKAPKTLRNFLKKVYNPDLSINENFNIKMFRNNSWSDPDDYNFWDDSVVLKSIVELEIIYNNSVSGKRWFFAGPDSDEKNYSFVVWDKPRNRWEENEDHQNVKKYEIATYILKDYIISLKNKKKVNSVNSPNRFKIMEIE